MSSGLFDVPFENWAQPNPFSLLVPMIVVGFFASTQSSLQTRLLQWFLRNDRSVYTSPESHPLSQPNLNLVVNDDRTPPGTPRPHTTTEGALNQPPGSVGKHRAASKLPVKGSANFSPLENNDNTAMTAGEQRYPPPPFPCVSACTGRA